MSFNITIQLRKLGFYFAANSKQVNMYSNYFFIGSRENYVVLRLHAVIESLKRLQLFVRVLITARPEVWSFCTEGCQMRLARWVARSFRGHFINWSYQKFVFLRWRGRYYVIDEPLLRFKLGRYIGVDVVFLFNRANLLYMSAFASRAAVVLLGTPGEALAFAGYHLICSADTPLMYAFYGRAIAMFCRLGRM